MAYAFDFIDHRGRIARFDLVSHPNDEIATEAAGRALLDSRTAVRVEIWESMRRVALVERK